MVLDITPFIKHRNTIKRIFANNEGKDLQDKVGVTAVATGIHIVAVGLICGQDVGYSEELLTMIDGLKDFYKITRVVGENLLERV